jgi:hypothetical protein
MRGHGQVLIVKTFGKSGKRWLGYVENDLNEMAGQNSYL